MTTAGFARRVAIVGGGLIGQSWAALFQAAGCEVRLWDPSAAVRAQAEEAVAPLLAQLRELGMACLGSLQTVASLQEAVGQADWIQENAPEDVALKRQLYAQIEALAPAAATLASSTSSLVWSALTADMAAPDRLIVAHPFNPPHLIPLVELYGIDDARMADAEAFYASLGRVTIRLRREAVGHVANRLSSALWREAVHIVAQGIASVEDVDRAMVNGPGLRWSVQGPHLSYHLGGGDGGLRHYLAHLGPSQMRRWRDLGQPELSPEVCERLVDGVLAQSQGRTIGQLREQRDDALMRALKLRSGLADSTVDAPGGPTRN